MEQRKSFVKTLFGFLSSAHSHISFSPLDSAKKLSLNLFTLSLLNIHTYVHRF